MAELDKKVQKPQTELVQAVLDAQEKKNLERVDMLVTNAIKQLKISRFKPDPTTCISLTYLARVCPKVFSQSNAIKEVLKSLLRRDSGPANLKAKIDILLPILAANILLFSCDSSEVRSMIISKIEQWLSSNQKSTDLIQHLLATLCIKCQDDQLTVTTLIEMRHHWLQYLVDNFHFYGSVSSDICSSIRKLLQTETNSEHLVLYVKFLIKYDTDVISLAKEISRFINDRPMSLNNMYKEQDSGNQLVKIVMKVFVKLVDDTKVKLLDKFVIEAVLNLLASVGVNEEYQDEFNKLLNNFVIKSDLETSNELDPNAAYSFPMRLRQKLVHSENDLLIDLGLRNANPAQLVNLLHQFGTSTSTINKILMHLESVKDIELIRCEIRDMSFFNQLMDFYSDSKKSGNAAVLQKRLDVG